MGSYARVTSGQPPEVTRKALEAVQLSEAHTGFSLIEQLKQVVPFRHIAISGLDIEGYAVGSGAFLLSDFPTDYLAEYYAGDHIDNDPLVDAFKTGAEVSRDSEAFSTPHARLRGREVLDVLRRHGIQERTIIRIIAGGKTRGTLNLISDRPIDDGTCILVQSFALSLHLKASQPILESLNATLKLTKGEIYCLQLAAKGMTSEEIAGEDVYSVDTINTYLKLATRKLGAQNRTQAVAEALRRQLIA